MNFGSVSNSFREDQLSYSRVKQAYTDKLKTVDKTLSEHAISRDNLRIYLRAFKTEKKIELWANLKKGYDLFNLTKVQPNVKVLADGQYELY